MSNLKATVITPEMLGFTDDTLAASNVVTGAMDSYAKVPLVFRATRIRCNALLKIPIHLYEGDSENEADYPFQYPLRKLIWRTEAALLLRGASFTLKRRNRVMTKDVQWLNPFTVDVQWDFANQQPLFRQFASGAMGMQTFPANGYWTPDEMIYIQEFSLRDDIGPGDCSASVALNDARLSHSLTRFAASFFEKGAMPVTLITADDGFGSQVEDVQSFYRRAMQGLHNAWRVLAVKARGVQFHNPQSPLKDLASTELKEQARKDVALAFEIPVTLLDDDANYATAKEHKRGFYDETVIPRADMLTEELNAQLFGPLGLRLEFAPEEMDLYQEDENESAQAAQTFNTMLNDSPTFEQFEFVASVFGIEYDADKAKAWYAAKEKQREETARNFVPVASTLAQGNVPASTDAAQQPAPRAAVQGDSATAKALKAANMDGGMIALALPSAAATALANASRAGLGEDANAIPPEQMHITLAYFPDAAALADKREIIAALVRVFASEHGIVNGMTGGKGQFNHVDEDGRSAVYASFDSPDLPAFQHDLVEMLDAAGITPDKTHGLTPHITLAYVSDNRALAEIDVPNVQLTFDAVTLAWAGEWTAFPLTTSMKANISPRGEMFADLAKWERAALKRIKRGGDLAFHSESIPPTLHASVLGALESAADAAQVKAIFANAQAWGAYP